MKNFLPYLLVSLLLLNSGLCFPQSLFPTDVYQLIENPGILEINQEPGHAPLVAFDNLNKAIANEKDVSQGYLSLNGMWKFLNAGNQY